MNYKESRNEHISHKIELMEDLEKKEKKIEELKAMIRDLEIAENEINGKPEE